MHLRPLLELFNLDKYLDTLEQPKDASLLELI